MKSHQLTTLHPVSNSTTWNTVTSRCIFPPPSPLLHHWLLTTVPTEPNVGECTVVREEDGYDQLYESLRRSVWLRSAILAQVATIRLRTPTPNDGRWSVARRHFQGIIFLTKPWIRTHFLNTHGVLFVTSYLIPETPHVPTPFAFFIKTFLTDAHTHTHTQIAWLLCSNSSVRLPRLPGAFTEQRWRFYRWQAGLATKPRIRGQS